MIDFRLVEDRQLVKFELRYWVYLLVTVLFLLAAMQYGIDFIRLLSLNLLNVDNFYCIYLHIIVYSLYIALSSLLY